MNANQELRALLQKVKGRNPGFHKTIHEAFIWFGQFSEVEAEEIRQTRPEEYRSIIRELYKLVIAMEGDDIEAFTASMNMAKDLILNALMAASHERRVEI